MPRSFSVATGLFWVPHNDLALRVSSVLSGGSGLNPQIPTRGSHRVLSLHHIPHLVLCPVPSISPVVGRKAGFSISALDPRPRSRPLGPRTGSRHLARGTRPFNNLPVYACPPKPPPPARLGGCPPRTAKPLSVPAPPLFKSAGGGSVAPGRAVPGGSGRSGETTESAERSPGPSPSEAGDGGAAGADVQRVAEPASRARAPRLHAPLLGERSRPLPSRLGPRPRARPLSGGPAPPRPAPPLRGTLQ